MRKIIVPIICVLLLLIGGYYLFRPPSARVVINGHQIIVDVAVTPAEKELGLGQRNSLCPDCGMLFVYDHKEVFPFWMKGMQFPLDFIWIADKTVVDITQNVPVSSGGTYPIYHPNQPVDQILEVNAGVVDQFKIKVGDPVKYSF